MNGLITDASGQPLPGATIVAVHTPTGSQYGTATLPNGRFNLPNIKVGGPYTVTVSFVGYRDQIQEGINLSLGQNFTIDFKLQESDVQLSEVEVTGNRDDILNSDRTGAATNVRGEQIQALPTINRAVNDFTRLTPQFSSNNSFNGFAGRSNLNNNFSLDGAVYNNVYGLTELPAGQTNAQPVSLDAIQELQIQIAPFDVRQGGFTGAGVNAITRSGTNEFSGSVYSFFKNQNLIGKKVGDATVTQNEFTDNQYGLRFGGPIIKNKLFFFVSAELTRVNEPAGTFRAARPGEVQGEGDVARVNASTLDSLRTFLITRYGYDPGAYENYNFETQNDKLFARLDWNINQNHKLTLRHNFVDASRDVGISNSGPVAFGGRGINIDRLPFQNANYIINEKVHSTVLELNSTFGTRFANNLILTGTTLRNFREVPGSGTQFPHVEIGNGRGQGFTSFGYEMFSAENRLDQDYIQITDNFSIYAGRHVITLGTSNEFYNFDNSFIANYKGNYSFYTLQDFYAAADLPAGTTSVPVSNARPVSYTLTYPQVEGTLPTAKFKAYQLSVYAQDEWQILNTFKLTGGIRLDLPVFPDTFRENQAVTEAFGPGYGVSTANLPKANPLISPRLGFNWDAKGDRSLQVRGGTGIFSGRPLYAWIGSNVNLNGINYYDVQLTTNGGFTNLAGRPDVVFNPSIPQPTLPPTASRAQINVISRDFRFPQVWRTNMAIDYRLPLGVIATLEGMYSKDVNAVFFRDINMVQPTATIPQDGREAFPAGNKPGTSPSIPNRIVDNRFTNVVLMENTTKGYQYFLTASLQKNFNNGIFANVAYNFSRSEDLTSGSSSQPTSAFNNNQVVGNPNDPVLATSNYEQRHRVIANASYRLEYAKFAGTTFSFFYQAYSGAPYSYIYAGDLNRDGIASNDLIYVPGDMNDISLVRVSGSGANRTVTAAPQEDYDALENYINQDPYLSENRGSFTERNAATTPWTFRLDARIMQDFFVNVKGKRNTIQLSLDVINLGNLLNKNWGITQLFNRNNFLGFVDNNGADGEAGNEDDRPRFTYAAVNTPFINNTGITSRWQMQFGVRYIFN
jgi:hypothetical protein